METNAVGFLKEFGWIIAVALLVLSHRLILRLFGMVTIPQGMSGIVVKKFTLVGKNRALADGEVVALNGEAGLQVDMLAPGIHFGLYPWQYDITKQPCIVIETGKIGVVSAKGGKPISGGRVFGFKVDSNTFQDARAFLENGGERGPQLPIIPPGVYRINTGLFSVATTPALEVPDGQIGIVTTKDGQPLALGDIAGKAVEGHSMYQDGDAFIKAGGFKGLQEQVLLSGRYFVHPLFATVEFRAMTEIPIAHVGVMISFVGNKGKDVSGDAFKHGNMVADGQRGVCAEPLDPGKYPINTAAYKVELVPTANVVLNWATGKSEAHKLDANLCTITVRSADGFKFNLDVSQIIQIPRNDAPKVIARFGSVSNLVTQVLEPTIGNYFRNAAQSGDVISFLRERTKRQEEAKLAISTALAEFNVGAVDTLIGDITPPEDLMATLTSRKIAEQEQVTYETQRQAEVVRKELQQAKAQADTQARVVDAERSVQIAEFNANAKVKAATGEAESKKINVSADAQVVTQMGEAEAGKIKAVGTAEADVIKLKIDSMESGNYAMVQAITALAEHGIKLVPDIVAGGNGDGQHGSGIVDVLMANILRDQLNGKSGSNGAVKK